MKVHDSIKNGGICFHVQPTPDAIARLRISILAWYNLFPDMMKEMPHGHSSWVIISLMLCLWLAVMSSAIPLSTCILGLIIGPRICAQLLRF
jgi:hypothetical protein